MRPILADNLFLIYLFSAIIFYVISFLVEIIKNKEKNEKGSKFCSKCGKSIETEKVCSNCGKKIENNDNFCPHCGQKQ